MTRYVPDVRIFYKSGQYTVTIFPVRTALFSLLYHKGPSLEGKVVMGHWGDKVPVRLWPAKCQRDWWSIRLRSKTEHCWYCCGRFPFGTCNLRSPSRYKMSGWKFSDAICISAVSRPSCSCPSFRCFSTTWWNCGRYLWSDSVRRAQFQGECKPGSQWTRWPGPAGSTGKTSTLVRAFLATGMEMSCRLLPSGHEVCLRIQRHWRSPSFHPVTFSDTWSFVSGCRHDRSQNTRKKKIWQSIAAKMVTVNLQFEYRIYLCISHSLNI